MVYPNKLLSHQNKQNKLLKSAAYKSATMHSAMSKTLAWLASQSASVQSAGTMSPTESRSASGRWDFTSPRVCYTASLAAPLTMASSQPRDATSLSNRLSAAATPSGSNAPSRASSCQLRRSSIARASVTQPSASTKKHSAASA